MAYKLIGVFINLKETEWKLLYSKYLKQQLKGLYTFNGFNDYYN